MCAECSQLKKEGRVLLLELSPALCIIVVYVPNGGKEKSAEVPLKTEFLRRLAKTIARLRVEGKSVVLMGDLNVVAKKIDIWYDLGDFEKKQMAGEPCMSKAVAEWLENLLSDVGGGMVDSFRELHPGLISV